MIATDTGLREKARRERDTATRKVMESVERCVVRGTPQHERVRKEIIDALELMEAHIVNYAITGSR